MFAHLFRKNVNVFCFTFVFCINVCCIFMFCILYLWMYGCGRNCCSVRKVVVHTSVVCLAAHLYFKICILKHVLLFVFCILVCCILNSVFVNLRNWWSTVREVTVHTSIVCF